MKFLAINVYRFKIEGKSIQILIISVHQSRYYILRSSNNSRPIRRDSQYNQYISNNHSNFYTLKIREIVNLVI